MVKAQWPKQINEHLTPASVLLNLALLFVSLAFNNSPHWKNLKILLSYKHPQQISLLCPFSEKPSISEMTKGQSDHQQLYLWSAARPGQVTAAGLRHG